MLIKEYGYGIREIKLDTLEDEKELEKYDEMFSKFLNDYMTSVMEMNFKGDSEFPYYDFIESKGVLVFKGDEIIAIGIDAHFKYTLKGNIIDSINIARQPLNKNIKNYYEIDGVSMNKEEMEKVNSDLSTYKSFKLIHNNIMIVSKNINA